MRAGRPLQPHRACRAYITAAGAAGRRTAVIAAAAGIYFGGIQIIIRHCMPPIPYIEAHGFKTIYVHLLFSATPLDNLYKFFPSRRRTSRPLSTF